MAALIPSANASGSGTMTLAGPSTNSNQTVTIPDATGTMLLSSTVGVCRAWVNFSGGGTTINSSFNVSSITYIGTGTTTINFTSAMPNANYAMSINNSFASGTTEAVFGVCYNDSPYAPTTSSVTVKFYRGDTNAAINPTLGYVLIFSS
tara:strand:- start:981 stop:1427 length:447 start_codon:yes stop_codon:yes gene_type:complete